MDELNFSSGDNESRIPRRFRDVVFWEHPIIEDYQVYTDLLFCGWWYRLRPTTPFDDSCPASGFQIEAFVYGEKSPRCNLADLQIFDSLTLVEIFACIAVMTEENSDPSYLFSHSLRENERVRTRIRKWLEHPPVWLCNLVLPYPEPNASEDRKP
jgi:hypothetical protein